MERFSNRFGELLVGEFSSGRSPCVVLLHGFSAYKNFGVVNELFLSFSDTGRSVFRFDFSGNGESEGLFGDSTFSKQAKEVVDVLDYLEREFSVTEVVLVGHSMGGAVALLAAGDARVQSVVCLAGAVLPQQDIARRPERFFAGNELSVPHVKGVTLPKREYVISEQWIADAKRVDPLGAFPDKPVLAVHGSGDVHVLLDSSRALEALGARLVVLETDHFFSGVTQELSLLLEEFIS